MGFLHHDELRAADTVDLTVTGTGASGSFLVSTDSLMSGSGGTMNGAHDFDPAPVDTCSISLTVVEHSTGEVLAAATAAVPAAIIARAAEGPAPPAPRRGSTD